MWHFFSNNSNQHNEDLFALYFRLQAETEPPVIYHRWSLATCLSAYLGRRFWLQFGEQKIFPNCYTMLIGHPGARKSTAIKLAKKLFSSAGYSTFAAEKTSKEKFLLDLEGKEELENLSKLPGGRSGSGKKRNNDAMTRDELMESLFGKDGEKDAIKEPKEVFVVADEFNEFVGSGNLEFLSLLGMLWDWDDDAQEYQFRLKNSKSVSIYQPTITILAGNTHAGFVEAFPPQAIGQGFLSRLILVYGEPSGKKIPIPPPPDPRLRDPVIAKLLEIKQKVVGVATLEKEAREALSMIYNSQKDLDDGRFKHYSNRRYTHMIKLALLCCAARVSTTLTVSDIIYANSILTYTENDMPKALGEFGKSRDGDIAGKIMTALYEATRPMQVTDLMKLVKNDLDKEGQLREIIGKLLNAGQIQNISGKGFLPKVKVLSNNQLFTNFEMLKEWQVKHGNMGLRAVK